MAFTKEEKIARLKQELSIYGPETQESFAETLSIAGPLKGATQYTISPNFPGGRSLLTAADLYNSQIVLDTRKKDPAARNGAAEGIYSDNITRISNKIVGVFQHTKTYDTSLLGYQGTLGLGSAHKDQRNFFYASPRAKKLVNTFDQSLALGLLPQTKAEGNLKLLVQAPNKQDASRELIKDIVESTGPIYVGSATLTSPSVVNALALKAQAGASVTVKFSGLYSSQEEYKIQERLAKLGVKVLIADPNFKSHSNLTSIVGPNGITTTIGTLRFSRSAIEASNQTNSYLKVTGETDFNKAVIEEITSNATIYEIKSKYGALSQNLEKLGYSNLAIDQSLHNTLPSVLSADYFASRRNYFKNQALKGHALDKLKQDTIGPYSSMYEALHQTFEVPAVFKSIDSDLMATSWADELNDGITPAGQALRAVVGAGIGAVTGFGLATALATSAKGLRNGRISMGVAGALGGAYALMKAGSYKNFYNENLGVVGSAFSIVGKAIDSFTTEGESKLASFSALAARNGEATDTVPGFFESMTTGVYGQFMSVFTSTTAYALFNYPISILLSKQAQSTLDKISTLANTGKKSNISFLATGFTGEFNSNLEKFINKIQQTSGVTDAALKKLNTDIAYTEFDNFLKQSETTGRGKINHFSGIGVQNLFRKKAAIGFKYAGGSILTAFLLPIESQRPAFLEAINNLTNYLGTEIKPVVEVNQATGLKEFVFRNNKYDYAKHVSTLVDAITDKIPANPLVIINKAKFGAESATLKHVFNFSDSIELVNTIVEDIIDAKNEIFKDGFPKAIGRGIKALVKSGNIIETVKLSNNIKAYNAHVENMQSVYRSSNVINPADEIELQRLQAGINKIKPGIEESSNKLGSKLAALDEGFHATTNNVGKQIRNYKENAFKYGAWFLAGTLISNRLFNKTGMSLGTMLETTFNKDKLEGIESDYEGSGLSSQWWGYGDNPATWAVNLATSKTASLGFAAYGATVAHNIGFRKDVRSVVKLSKYSNWKPLVAVGAIAGLLTHQFLVLGATKAVKLGVDLFSGNFFKTTNSLDAQSVVIAASQKVHAFDAANKIINDPYADLNYTREDIISTAMMLKTASMLETQKSNGDKLGSPTSSHQVNILNMINLATVAKTDIRQNRTDYSISLQLPVLTGIGFTFTSPFSSRYNRDSAEKPLIKEGAFFTRASSAIFGKNNAITENIKSFEQFFFSDDLLPNTQSNLFSVINFSTLLGAGYLGAIGLETISPLFKGLNSSAGIKVFSTAAKRNVKGLNNFVLNKLGAVIDPVLSAPLEVVKQVSSYVDNAVLKGNVNKFNDGVFSKLGSYTRTNSALGNLSNKARGKAIVAQLGMAVIATYASSIFMKQSAGLIVGADENDARYLTSSVLAGGAVLATSNITGFSKIMPIFGAPPESEIIKNAIKYDKQNIAKARLLRKTSGNLFVKGAANARLIVAEARVANLKAFQASAEIDPFRRVNKYSANRGAARFKAFIATAVALKVSSSLLAMSGVLGSDGGSVGDVTRLFSHMDTQDQSDNNLLFKRISVNADTNAGTGIAPGGVGVIRGNKRDLLSLLDIGSGKTGLATGYIDQPNAYLSVGGVGVSIQTSAEKGISLKSYLQIQLQGEDISSSTSNLPTRVAANIIGKNNQEFNIAHFGNMSSSLQQGIRRRLMRVGAARKASLKYSSTTLGDKLGMSGNALVSSEMAQRAYLQSQYARQSAEQLSKNYLHESFKNNKPSGNDLLSNLLSKAGHSEIPNKFGNLNIVRIVGSGQIGQSNSFDFDSMTIDQQVSFLQENKTIETQDTGTLSFLGNVFNKFVAKPASTAFNTATSSLPAIAMSAIFMGTFLATAVPTFLTSVSAKFKLGTIPESVALNELKVQTTRARYNSFSVTKMSYNGFTAEANTNKTLWDRNKRINYSLAQEIVHGPLQSQNQIEKSVLGGMQALFNKERGATNLNNKANRYITGSLDRTLNKINTFNEPTGFTGNNTLKSLREKILGIPSTNFLPSEKSLKLIDNIPTILENYEKNLSKHLYATLGQDIEAFKAINPEVEERIAQNLKVFSTLGEEIRDDALKQFQQTGKLSSTFIAETQVKLLSKFNAAVKEAPTTIFGLKTMTVDDFFNEAGSDKKSFNKVVRTIGAKATHQARAYGSQIQNRIAANLPQTFSPEENIILNKIANRKLMRATTTTIGEGLKGIGKVAGKMFNASVFIAPIWNTIEALGITADPSSTRYAKEKSVGIAYHTAIVTGASVYAFSQLMPLGAAALGALPVIGASIASFFAAPAVAIGAVATAVVGGLALGADQIFNKGQGTETLLNWSGKAVNKISRGMGKIWKGITSVFEKFDKTYLRPFESSIVSGTTKILDNIWGAARGTVNLLGNSLGNQAGKAFGSFINNADKLIQGVTKFAEGNAITGSIAGFFLPTTVLDSMQTGYNQQEELTTNRPFSYASFSDYSTTKYQEQLRSAIKDYTGAAIRSSVVSSEELGMGIKNPSLYGNARYTEGKGRVLSSFQGTVNRPSTLLMDELDLRGGLTGLKVFAPMVKRYALFKGLIVKREYDQPRDDTYDKPKNINLEDKTVDLNTLSKLSKSKKLEKIKTNILGTNKEQELFEAAEEKKKILATPSFVKNVLPSAADRAKQYQDNYFNVGDNKFLSGIFSSFKDIVKSIKKSVKETLNKAYEAVNNFLEDKAQDLLGYGNPSSTTSVDRNTSGYKRYANKKNSALATPGFTEGVEAMSKRLGMNPNTVLAVMAFETSGTMNSSIKNPTSSASGLIQFMDSTAKELGTSTAQLRAMSPTDQLNYVEKYFKNKGGKNRKGWQDWEIYAAVAAPAYISKGKDAVAYTQGSEAYKKNKIWDVNKDGKIQAGEFIEAVKSSSNSKGFMSGDNSFTGRVGETANTIANMSKEIIGNYNRAQKDIIAFGKLVQKKFGYRISEHSYFEGGRHISSGHSNNSAHYSDNALDINSRAGTSVQEQQELDVVAAMAKTQGFNVIWRTEGHFNHLHLDTKGYKPTTIPEQPKQTPVKEQIKNRQQESALKQIEHAEKLGKIVSASKKIAEKMKKQTDNRTLKTITNVPSIPMLQHENETFMKTKVPKLKAYKQDDNKISFVELDNTDMSSLVHGQGTDIAYNPMNSLS
jgi:hypothetical protein